MKLTFPIDTKDPDAIPEFEEAFGRHGDTVEDLNGMLRYLCYRFDPASPVYTDSGAKSLSIEDRSFKASELSKWWPPEPNMVANEALQQVIDPVWAEYSEVMGLFFKALDMDEWEFIVSLDIAIHNGHMVIREPIPAQMDAETKGKVLLNVQKAVEGNARAMELRKKKALELANGDEQAAKSIQKATKRYGISPEGNLGGK